MAQPSSPSGDRSTRARAWLGFAVGLAGLLWLPVSLWPRLGAPAWPCVGLGALGLVLSFDGRGHPLLRGVGGALALFALLGGTLQIAVLWGALELLRATEH